MRVLAIGLGGAGSRIVDTLYDHDQKSRVRCVNAFAIDLDPNALQQLRHIPGESRLYFPPIDPHHPFDVSSSIPMEEVMTRLHRVDTSRIDALMVCCGLGGTLVDAAPRLIQELRRTFREPIFIVATLPCRKEGPRRSAEAIDDLDALQQLADAVILFDNDLWYSRLKARPVEKADMPERRGISLTNPLGVYISLNEKIARYIGLMLRAGEFSEKGIEVAEVVLDAGEVLNTITGMGLASIGYAVEELQGHGIPILEFFKPKKARIEEMHEKAVRIVSLAKKAVYEEMSIFCDITSAVKALVLIAGPSHELSMRGFQTVRKWIDRSISGLEMRSGDYPVKNTRFVGIVVVLSGLKNIPRIEEMRQIRDQYRTEAAETQPAGAVSPEAPATVQPIANPSGVQCPPPAITGAATGAPERAIPKRQVQASTPDAVPHTAAGRGRGTGADEIEEEAFAMAGGIRERYGTKSDDKKAASSGAYPEPKEIRDERSSEAGKTPEKEIHPGERRTRRRKKESEDFGITWIR